MVCVPRTHFMYPEMEKMTTRYQMHQTEYYASLEAASGSGSDAKAATAAAAS